MARCPDVRVYFISKISEPGVGGRATENKAAYNTVAYMLLRGFVQVGRGRNINPDTRMQTDLIRGNKGITSSDASFIFSVKHLIRPEEKEYFLERTE